MLANLFFNSAYNDSKNEKRLEYFPQTGPAEFFTLEIRLW